MHSIAAVPMELRDHKGPKVPQGQMVPQGRQVLPDRKDLLVPKVLRGRAADSIAGI
jgi:hypothetical protein